VVSSAEQLAKLREVQAQLPSLRAIVCMDTFELRAPREHAFADVIATGGERRRPRRRAFRERAAPVRPEDLATIIYTSGTTGEPKGAMLTHHNIVFDLAACYELVTITSEDVSLSFLPLCHVFERMAGLYGMLRGGVTIAYAQSMDTVATDVREVRPTIINGVPRFYEKVHARILARVQEAPAFRQRLFAWGMRHLEQALAHTSSAATSARSRCGWRIVSSRTPCARAWAGGCASASRAARRSAHTRWSSSSRSASR
jgi:long-chain acyl-CoA synthetase